MNRSVLVFAIVGRSVILFASTGSTTWWSPLWHKITLILTIGIEPIEAQNNIVIDLPIVVEHIKAQNNIRLPTVVEPIEAQNNIELRSQQWADQ